MQCPKCGMGYVPGLAEDEAEHSRYCDLIVHGAPVGTRGDEEVIWSNEVDRVVLVMDSSPEEQRKLAQSACSCANREMRFDGGIYRYNDPPDERQIHIFLNVRASRVVAICLFERRSHVWRCTWNFDETPTCIEQPDSGPMWSVGFVWVHKKVRRAGVALTLLHQARSFLGLGEGDFGWYTPFSQSGEALVRKLCPTSFIVAK